MFPLVSDYTHICFLLDLLLQLLMKLLLLSRSAHSHAVRLKIPHLLRTARVPTIEVSSRRFSSMLHRRWAAMDAHRTLLVHRLG